MPLRRPLPTVALALVLALGLAACNKDDTTTPTVTLPGDAVPDFALTDANSTSTTFGQPVSPRDYLQQVSAWYFGHAT